MAKDPNRERQMFKRPLTHIAGPVLFVVLLASMFVVRAIERGFSVQLQAGELVAQQTIAMIHKASLAALQQGRSHPGLLGDLIAGLPSLKPLPDLGFNEITYAHDNVYMYGIATNAHRDPISGELVHGYVLRAWPLRYGRSGDAEFQLSDSGLLWEGQNRLGRSGTDYGFPPAFPQPEIGQPGAAWWPIRLPDQR